MQQKTEKSFEDRLKQAEQKDHSSHYTDSKYTKAVNTSKDISHTSLLGISSELLGGIFMGLGCGFLLDHLFKTKPLFLAIMIPFGAFIGLYNVYRYISKPTSQASLSIKRKKEKPYEKKIDEP